MAGKRDKPEEVVSKLRQLEVLQGQGATIAEAARQIGVTQQTFYRWRKLYGGMQRSQLARLKELETENQRRRPAFARSPDLTLDKLILTEATKGNFIRPLSSDQWRKMISSFALSHCLSGDCEAICREGKCIDPVRRELGVSERRACRTLGQHRSTQRKVPQGRADDERLTDDIIELADQYGRYGYRMVTGLLNNAGPLSAELLCKSPAR